MEYLMNHSKIIFYLLQDGCNQIGTDCKFCSTCFNTHNAFAEAKRHPHDLRLTRKLSLCSKVAAP